MRLLRQVEIRNFRSLRTVVIDDLDTYVPIVGLNGSGKSNVLRALNLFFTGTEVEPGVPFVLKRDHYDPGRRLGGQRRVSVRITFDLTQEYQPRANVQSLLTKIAADSKLVVERSWRYADPSGLETISELSVGTDDATMKGCPAEDLAAMGTFIRSIRFRFLPNHAQPAAILDREIQTLRRAINRRVRARSAFRTGAVADALEDLGAVTRDMFAELSESVVRFTPELQSVSPDIPGDFADLAFQLGLSTVTTEGTSKPTELQGSGTQSFLLLHVLDMVDRSAFEVDFGWTKAVVWAIEEPESFLHAGLRTRFASDLAEFSSGRRRQVFVTTHEAEFQRVADHVWLASRDGAPTNVRRLTARDGIREASRLRVSSFEHPLFLSPDRPLVIVEGPSDVDYLARAIQESDIRPKWTMTCIPTLDASQSGGTAVQTYLRANSAVLASRPLHAPVIVVRDWEDQPRTISEMNDALSSHETSICIKVPEHLANPDLGRKFRGIERYLPTALIESVMGDVLLRASPPTQYPLHVEKPDLDARKPALLKAFTGWEDAGDYLKSVVVWIDGEVATAIGAAPPGPMLLPL